MRRRLTVSSYLSLGSGIAPRQAAPLLGARVSQAPKPFSESDIVVAERITVKLIRDAVAQLAEGGVPPIPNVGRTGERFRVDPDPAAEGFGPFYEVHLPPPDMTAICGDPEFQAGERDGEFRVAGLGRVLIRPPMVAVDDIIAPATGKVLRCERNAIRLDKEPVLRRGCRACGTHYTGEGPACESCGLVAPVCARCDARHPEGEHDEEP